MDFLSADEFLDHLEMHPNGSFVLVKRDIPAPVIPPEEPIESDEPSTISPEMLGNQIKVSENLLFVRIKFQKLELTRWLIGLLILTKKCFHKLRLNRSVMKKTSIRIIR